MAIIGKIRKRSGLLVIIIGVALAAFVLGDFLKPGKRYRGTTNVGVVAGENIPYTEFAAKVDEQIENLKQRAQKENLSSEEVFSARQMTWQQLTTEIIMGEEYDRLGITVTTDELFELVKGKNPHPYILQYFKDPNTQQYNPQLVVNFLKQLETMEPAQRNNWLMLEKAIKEDRLRTKYNNLISKAYYAPKVFAKMDYEEKNTRYDIRVVAAGYQTIDDKTITLTEEDYKKYYEEHKYQFDQEASRDLYYVTYDLLPSDADRKATEKEVQVLFDEFQKATDIPTFVNANSDTKYDSSWRKERSLSPRLDSVMFNAPVGTIIPPFVENDAYTMAKLLDVQVRPDSLKANHILIAFQGSAVNDPKITRPKEKAKKIADSLQVVLSKNAAMFPAIAASMSDDASNKSKGGDLGWFTDGSMVGPFNKAVVEGKVGELKVVETVFGYHIIQIMDKRAFSKKAKVAIVDRKIEPSSQTIQELYTKASEFAGEVHNVDEFEKAITAKNLNKRVAESLKTADNNLPGLSNSRQIVQWAFNEETEKGAVSTVFEVTGSYVVVALKEKREKGIQPLELVKTQIEPLVKREKKAEKLMATIKSAGTADLYALATKLNSKVDTLPGITFYSPNLPKYGPEPELIGTITTLKKGVVSEPFKGNMNVYVILVDAVNPAPETKDYAMYVQQMQYTFANRVQREAYTALEKLADIEDNRVMFY